MKKISKPVNIVNIQSKKKDDNIELTNTEGCFSEFFYFNDFYNDTNLKKFIKHCERMIRTSKEYSSYIGFLNSELGLTNCAILGNVNKQDASIEMHHYPFTLYDIVSLCINKHILEGTKFNSFTITREVLDDHYKNIVGLVPLSKTVHELVHSGEIFINLKQVFGDINSFINKYYDCLSDDMIESYNSLVKFSNENINYSNNDILKNVK